MGWFVQGVAKVSPAKECTDPSCLQDRLQATDSTVGAVLQLLGHREDPLTSKKGDGLVGAFERLSAKLDELQAQTQRDSQEQRMQTAKALELIRAEIAALREEQVSRKEAPGKLIRWAVMVLPLIAATIGTVSWAVTHLRVIQ